MATLGSVAEMEDRGLTPNSTRSALSTPGDEIFGGSGRSGLGTPIAGAGRSSFTFPQEIGDGSGEGEDSFPDQHHDLWRDPFSHLSLEEVTVMLEQAELKTKTSTAQTKMFEDYLEKERKKEADISELADATAAAEQAARSSSKKDSTAPDAATALSTSSRRRSKRSQANLRTTKKQAAPLTLTSTQRCQVASEKLQNLTKHFDSAIEGWQKARNVASAEANEMDEFIAIIDELWYKFDKQVLHILSHIGNKYSSERINHVHHERLKQDAVLIDHLRLRTQVTKGQIASAMEELSRQESMEEDHSQVDYDQLKIKNTEYVHYLHEGNSSLLVEKTNVMHSMRQHNSAVNHLQGATKVQQDLENHLADARRMLARLAKEQLQADNEVEAGKRQFKVARSHLQTFKVPAVIDYVKDVVCELQTSEHNVKTWLRRVQVADAQMHLHKKAWVQVTTSIRQADPRRFTLNSPV